MADAAVCISVISQKNEPLYLRCSNDEETRLKLHYTVFSSLDIIEEKLANIGKSKDDPREMYHGLLYPTEDYKIYGYVSNTKVRYVIVISAMDSITRDNEIKNMFTKLHNAYVNMVSNPFYIPGSQITSPKFEKIVTMMMKV